VLGVALIIGYVLLTRQILKLHRAMTENISMKFDSRHMSYIDPLTNLWNRRRLYLFLDKLIPAARRSNKPFSLILIDVDHFKQYNDTHGHNAGDELLTDISRVLLECSREQDLVVRYGGEEFMVVMPTTTTEQARPLAERIRAQVKETTAVTVSAGLGEFAGEATVDQLVKRADRALYAAKEAGRDTLKIADATE
jgi:diguanylate cyclase (GGDEF)-like protein